MQDFVTYNPNGIPIKLPLIELLKKNFNVSVNRPLSDFCLIAVQHIQGSTIPLIEALGESGTAIKLSGAGDSYLPAIRYRNYRKQ